MFENPKIVSMDRIIEISKDYRAKGKTIVTINGSYDMLQAGHVYSIKEAAKFKGEGILIVGVNSDQSVKEWKKMNNKQDWKYRPIIPENDRAYMVAAIGEVDFVTIFSEPLSNTFIKNVMPNHHVTSAEYRKDCPEANLVEEIGAKLHFVERLGDVSTTNNLQKYVNAIESLKKQG